MQALIAIPLTCWLCALVAIPRKPRFGNEVEELVYARLLGRQQRLVLLACVVSALTVGTLVLTLPHRNDAELSALGRESVACVEHGTYAVCNAGTTGTRAIRERQEDGTWVTVGAVTMPRTFSTTNNDIALQVTNCAEIATPDGTGPLVVGNAAGNPAENTQGEELTPLRGHEQVAISLAQPVVAGTGLCPFAGTGLWP